MPRDFEQALLKVKEAIEITSPAGAKNEELAVEPMWKEKLLQEIAEGLSEI